MGESKPLLPMGSASVIERVVGAVSRAEVDDIIVVTGHQPEGLAVVLDGLPARSVHNAGYEAGMFSSVLTGVTALRQDVEAFLLLPADCPLVGTEVLDRLITAFRRGGAGILHPTCCGRRGHPPLLSGRYRDALLRADDGGDLRSFLRGHASDEAEVEVEDLTILMDMDTAEDYRRLCRLAAALDMAAAQAPGGSGSAPSAVAEPAALSFEDALYLLSLLEVPDRIVRHCRAVAMVGEALALALKPRVPQLDVERVRVAGLLHDMARTCSNHAIIGRGLLDNLGQTRLGSIVGAHMVLPSEHLETALVTEEQLIYLADKLVVDDKIGRLEDRAARMMREWGPGPVTPEALKGMRARMQVAEVIREKVGSIHGRSVDEVLPRETP
jgi:molybdenum cofactor cytidylyltransferase